MTALSDFCVKGGEKMAQRAKANNIRNHIRQRRFREQGILMLPKKPIREKNRHKQLAAAKMMLRANGSMRRKPAKA